VARSLLQERAIENLSVHVVWSSQLGAEEHHAVDAAGLMVDPRVRHYWDRERRVGAAYQDRLGLGGPAWDVWLLFAPGTSWPPEAAPDPAWWEHQLRALDGLYPDRRLDPDRFAARAEELAAAARGGETE
jgi:hypothetical protein